MYPQKTTFRRGAVTRRPGTVDFELFLRYCSIACANARAGRVSVFWDSVSVRVYEESPAGEILAFTVLESPIDEGR